MPPDETKSLKATLEDLLERKLIRESKAPGASPVFFVRKEGQNKTLVQDYRNLNAITIKNAYPLPLIPDLIDKLHGARYFTKFDVHWGYNNIRIQKGDEWKAAFKTPFGLFKPLVMFFGLCNSPATFQSFMNMVFKELIDSGHVIVYMDDILIFTDTLEELRLLTHQVLQVIEKYDLFLKPEKCFFAQTTIEYLGLVITDSRVSMDPAKVTGITLWPQPRTLKQLQAFLGFCNFYCRFILSYSQVARPLFNLTKKDVPFLWTPEADAAFQSLKAAFISAPVLALPDHSKPFWLIVDASNYAIRAILEQPDELNRWHPLTYLSKSLDPTQRNWVIHDKELWSIIWPLVELRHYFEGAAHPIEIWTDHNNLTYFMTKQKLTRRQAHWALMLSHYDLQIIHKPGAYNRADPLSRRTDHKEGIEHDNGDRVLLDTKILAINALRPGNITSIPTDIKTQIRECQNHDPEVSTALATILANGPKSITKGLEDWNLEDGLILRQGRIYVPQSPELQKHITQTYHESPATGHPGHWKTYELLTREYWWPGMSTFVKDFVDGCAQCQTTKTLPKTTVPLQPNNIPANVWQIVTMDFIMDLPQSKGYDSLLVTVDRFSKAVILSPCNKTVTTLETTELFLNNVWRRVGLPRQIISDQGPQFAAKITQELWKKLDIKSSLSTAFHPQTDGETERVNQEIEQYLQIFCNYQQDNWADLLPFAEFAHNIRSHSATKRSPFEVWYGYQPEFIPPLHFATTLPALEERLQTLEQLRQEVAASLKVAADIMRQSRPDAPTHRFKEGDLVFLEGTNIQTTHPKAKLAPRRHGPFKVTTAFAVTSRLDLPPSWHIHPVFHNSLLRPYKETSAHGPNYTKPPPEIVEGESDHYEIETVIKSCLSPNRRGIQYLVKWKGYPDAENSWIAASGMKHATYLTQAFHKKYPWMPGPSATGMARS
jgi:transposase InsO family protein